MIYNNDTPIVGHKQPSTDGKTCSTSNINQLDNSASLHNACYQTRFLFGGCNTGYKCAKWSTYDESARQVKRKDGTHEY